MPRAVRVHVLPINYESLIKSHDSGAGEYVEELLLEGTNGGAHAFFERHPLLPRQMRDAHQFARVVRSRGGQESRFALDARRGSLSRERPGRPQCRCAASPNCLSAWLGPR